MQVISVNVDEPIGEVKSFLTKERIEFPVYCDPKDEYFRAVGILGIIEQVLIVDKDGKILAYKQNAQYTAKQIADYWKPR